MVLYEVFSHSVKIRYLTSIFSRASIVQFVCIVLSLLGPFLVAYYTGGFWIKDKQFIEQARTNFQYRYICILEDDSNVYLSSSYENVNQIYINDYKPSIRTIYEWDQDNDGFYDLLEFNLFISGVPSTIKNVKLLLLFNVSLSVYAGLALDTIGYLESYNSIPTSEIEFSGELKFVQKTTLRSNIFYDYSLLNNSNVDLDELNLPKIVRDYNSRDYSTRLATDYVSWKNTIADGFNVKAFVRYTPFNINFVPAFWEQFKWGWIQYVAVLLPFLFVFKLAKIFIFENQLVPTVVIDPAHKIKIS